MMNYLYCCHIKKLSWSQLQSHKKILNKAAQYDIERFKFDQDKCRVLVGKMLLLYILKQHENYHEKSLPTINYNAYQKPFIYTMDGYFNISHAQDWVVCSYSVHGEIGVDIEKIIAVDVDEYQAVMTANEYYRALNDPDFNFFQLWTLKEAVMKAQGLGFFLPPTSFELPYPFFNNSYIQIENRQWYLYNSLFKQDYSLSVASFSPMAIPLHKIILEIDKLLV